MNTPQDPIIRESATPDTDWANHGQLQDTQPTSPIMKVLSGSAMAIALAGAMFQNGSCEKEKDESHEPAAARISEPMHHSRRFDTQFVNQQDIAERFLRRFDAIIATSDELPMETDNGILNQVSPVYDGKGEAPPETDNGILDEAE